MVVNVPERIVNDQACELRIFCLVYGRSGMPLCILFDFIFRCGERKVKKRFETGRRCDLTQNLAADGMELQNMVFNASDCRLETPNCLIMKLCNLRESSDYHFRDVHSLSHTQFCCRFGV